MRRWLWLALICVVVIVVLGGVKVFQIRSAIAFAESFTEPSARVEAATAGYQSVQRYVRTIGEIVAPQSVELRNELEGRIVEVLFRSGEKVAPEQVLIRLDISEEQARLQAAKAREELAKLDLDRARLLLQKNTVSKERVDQANAEFSIAKATVLELQSIINKKTLRAPFAAVAGLHHLDVGEFLQANTPLVTLVGDSDSLWVDFTIPVGQRQLQPGEHVVCELNGEKQQAKILAVDVQVSATSRNLTVRAEIPAKSGWRPNSVVTVDVPVSKETRIVLPSVALLHDEIGDYVYVLERDETSQEYRAHRHPVQVSSKKGEEVVIAEGLAEGALVATDGAFKLRSNLLTFIGTSSVRAVQQ